MKDLYVEILKKMKDDYLTLMQVVNADFGNDSEKAHQRADDLLIELLTELGFSEVVDAYCSIEKWYG